MTTFPTTVTSLKLVLLHDGDFAARINGGDWGKRWQSISRTWWSGIELLPRDAPEGAVPFDKTRSRPYYLPQLADIQAELDAAQPARRMFPRTFDQIDRSIIAALIDEGDEQ
jgi:hypothetical protein